jgi:hypothetical protein
MSSDTHLTDCGLPGITRIPYGLHACHFYPDRAQLVEALVAYFLAGLYNHEKCLWITAAPLPAAEAREAMRATWPAVERHIEQGALRIVDFADWYGGVELQPGNVVAAWLREEETALAEGYRGLRITGNTSFVKREDWAAFMEYERLVGERLVGRRILALCSYELASCSGAQTIDVMRLHDCSFHRPDAAWQVMSVERNRP